VSGGKMTTDPLEKHSKNLGSASSGVPLGFVLCVSNNRQVTVPGKAPLI
jgi:hypothetical protein